MRSIAGQLLAVLCLLGGVMLQPVQATLFVSNYFDGSVYTAPNSGGPLTQFIPAGTNGLTNSVGMLIHPTTGKLLVANQSFFGGSIKIFDPVTGSYTPGETFGPATLTSPSAIVLGQHNDILVTGFFGSQGIYRFDYAGNPLPLIVGGAPNTPGAMSSVSNAVFGADNKLYVASYSTAKVLRFVWDPSANSNAGNNVLDTSIPDGVFVQSDGPNSPNNLSNPGGLAFLGNRLLVTNLTQQNILSYDAATGAFVEEFAPGTFQQGFPAQISVAQNSVLVAQTNYSQGIGQYDLDGNFVGTYAAPPLADQAISGAFLFYTPVPEPGTWAVLVLAGGGCWLYRRRQASRV